MNKLGKYLIRRPLGKGAMGIVYEGFDPAIERTVAIKTILPSQLNSAQYAEVMARFKREAQAAGRLNHQGIVAIYDYGEEVPEDLTGEEMTMMAPAPDAKPADRIAYIAMEFIKGRELRDFFEKGERFKLTDIARIMSEILDALDHAHSQGVVHRDMKPANVIVQDSGRIKIADFGIARVEASELTQTGMVLGTPSYMSPEQFMGHPVDGRSDLFSCGVILYQLLTGEKPFTGESTTTIMYKVLREEPVPPSQINLSLAPALDAVVRKALAKNPNERFQTGKEFAQALQAAVDAPQAQAPATTAAAVAAALAAPATTPSAQAPAADKRAIPAAAWAAVAAAFIAVAAGGYMLFGSRTANAPQAAQATPPAPQVAVAVVASAPAPAAAPSEPGTMVLSALGVVDSSAYKGDVAAAQAAAREDAKRQLVEKVLALYVDGPSLAKNQKLIDAKLLVNSGSFIRSVVQEGSADARGSLVEMPTRAVVSIRDVQRSLNQLSRDERIDFIRNQGDPRISIRIDIANDGGAVIGRDRSQLAENVVKDRIKSFGFRAWSSDGDNPANTAPADFAIKGDVKLKTLSMKLPASGLTVSKTAITSWTLKAVDTSSGEEVYVSTKLPTGQSWANEDQALAEIGKLVGDEFSKNFFLSYFSYRPQKTTLVLTNLPEGGAPLLLRELRSMRGVLDAQGGDAGRFQLQLAPGSASDIVQDAIVRPLNAKLGEACFALAGTNGSDVSVSLAPNCANAQMKAKLESGAPAGWKIAPLKTTT